MGELLDAEVQTARARLIDQRPEVLRDIAERAGTILEHLMVVMRRKKIKQRNRALNAADQEPTEKRKGLAEAKGGGK